MSSDFGKLRGAAVICEGNIYGKDRGGDRSKIYAGCPWRIEIC